jgi:hypothetical protein
LLLAAAWSACNRRALRIQLGLAGLVLALAAVTPVLHGGLATWHRAQQFPVLLEARSPLDLYFIRARGFWNRDKLPAPWMKPGEAPALRILLNDQPWPGLEIIEPEPDWRGYQELVLDATNPGPRDLLFTLRIHDRSHDQDFQDRFNRQLLLPARSRTVFRIATADIAMTPSGRRQNLAAMAGVQFIAATPIIAGEDMLYVSSIRLE